MIWQWLRHALELDHSPSLAFSEIVADGLTAGWPEMFPPYAGRRCPCKTCAKLRQRRHRR